MMVGNHKITFRKEIATFMDGLTWLFQIIMFLMLGLLVNPHEMIEVAVVALLIGVFMIVIGRPLSVFLCLLPFRKITLKSRLFVSWVGLRGAVPIIFATYPVVANVEGSDMTITMEMLNEADTLKDMNLPKGTLVMIVKRGDEFLIPNGTLKLHVGDKLLLISEKNKQETVKNE